MPSKGNAFKYWMSFEKSDKDFVKYVARNVSLNIMEALFKVVTYEVNQSIYFK